MAWKPTVDELASFMARSFTIGQQAAASPIIDAYSAQVQRHLRGKSLDETVIVAEEHVLEYGQERVFFRHKPVQSIDTIEIIAIDGITITVLDPSWFTRRTWGMEGLRGGETGETLRVSYTTSALDDVDLALVRGVILSASARYFAARVLADAHGIDGTLSVEGTSMQFGADEMVLSDADKAALPSRRPRAR